jgi:hypothetical protein
MATAAERCSRKPSNEACASLRSPLLLRLSARRLVLELLPLPRRFVVLPMDHMRVNLLRRADRPMPQARGHRRQWPRWPAGASSASDAGSGGSRPSPA